MSDCIAYTIVFFFGVFILQMLDSAYVITFSPAMFLTQSGNYSLQGTLYSLKYSNNTNGTLTKDGYPWSMHIVQTAWILRIVGVSIELPCIGIFYCTGPDFKYSNISGYTVLVTQVVTEVLFMVGCIVFVTDVRGKLGFNYADLTFNFQSLFYCSIVHASVITGPIFCAAQEDYKHRKKARIRVPWNKQVFVYRNKDSKLKTHRNTETVQLVSVYVPGNNEDGVRTLTQLLWDGQNVGIGKDARGLSHNSIEITDIVYIRNPSAFNKYVERKFAIKKGSESCGPLISYNHSTKPTSKIIETCDQCSCLGSNIDSTINEVYLFHGTTKHNAVSIKTEGFDVEKCRRAYCGKGLYFSESPVKADQYTGSGEDHVIILAIVLLGNMVLITNYDLMSNVSRPPCAKCLAINCKNICHRSKGTFDSVVLERPNGLFRECVVFENGLVYPEYIITYRRNQTLDTDV